MFDPFLCDKYCVEIVLFWAVCCKRLLPSKSIQDTKYNYVTPIRTLLCVLPSRAERHGGHPGLRPGLLKVQKTFSSTYGPSPFVNLARTTIDCVASTGRMHAFALVPIKKNVFALVLASSSALPSDRPEKSTHGVMEIGRAHV